IMLATPRSEAVAEPQEVFLPDRVQHLDHRALDDLVLQRRDAEGPLPSVRLGDIDSPPRQRPIGAAGGPGLEVPETLPEALAVPPPRHPVHPRRRVPPQGL